MKSKNILSIVLATILGTVALTNIAGAVGIFVPTSGGVTTVDQSTGAAANEIRDPLGNLLKVNADGSINVSGGGGSSSLTPWTYFTVTTNTATTIKNGAGVLGGIQNLSDSQQPAGNCTWFDSLTASGPILFSENGLGPDQIGTVPVGGRAFNTGLTVLCAVAPTTGIITDYR